ncbi:hypothetical protein CCACVL1_18482 [Corchorus capsularis]|uniref:Uncharacterized protein n=1 Tax=Corchorus capsularis TaxID=210143 RepID=A0A1R3HKY1_COCAP|nr:hypothetical protein CCACVL1_18482 [Corchorus capsularis]
MARLSWVSIAFFLILALSFATEITNAGKEGSVRREDESYQFRTSIDRFDHTVSFRLARKDQFALKTVRRPVMFGVRKLIIGSHACSSATIAARGACAFLLVLMVEGRNVHATTRSKLGKANGSLSIGFSPHLEI